ncbi:UNVERIFIED_CONTAM: hypothetical protein H355_011962 [Colinus virginianus]|nr:hypothetical protein H355_011962 [Colinus virginianus]
MTNLKELLQQSEDFKRFVETPALSSPQKQALLQQLSSTYKLQPLTSNLLQTLLENRRLPLLGRVAEAFEVLYRKEKGEVKCVVTSAQPLNSQQQKEVVAALQKRAGPRAKLLLEYVVNPQLMGGLVVRLGEQVLDFSVATRIERLQAQLMAPL